MLLQHFGGLQGVNKAGVEELQLVPGISKKLAEIIYSAFHGS
jgi:excinuclease ABC subunit C